MHKAIIAHKNSAIKKQVLTQGLMSKRIAPSVAYNKKQKNQTNENLIVMFDCQTMDSPIGQLVLISYQDKLVALVFADAVRSIKSYLIKQAPLLVDGQKNKNVKSEIQVLFTTKNSKVLSQAKKQFRYCYWVLSFKNQFGKLWIKFHLEKQFLINHKLRLLKNQMQSELLVAPMV